MNLGQGRSSNHPQKSIFESFKGNFLQDIVIFLALGPIGLLVIVLFFTIPVSNLSLVDFSVTDGNVNGTISLGTTGYCLYLPDKACSGYRPGYKIGQFFFQLSHFITCSYLLWLWFQRKPPSSRPSWCEYQVFFRTQLLCVAFSNRHFLVLCLFSGYNAQENQEMDRSSSFFISRRDCKCRVFAWDLLCEGCPSCQPGSSILDDLDYRNFPLAFPHLHGGYYL